MSEAKQEIKKLSELLSLNLIIPPYQRPYKWKSQQVIQLLDDIFEHIIIKNKTYRIGSVILHKDDVVDGQQRLTTISILLKCLDKNENTLLLNQNYKHKISKDNIVYNYRVIQNWLSKISDKEVLKNKILEKCEFVLFTVSEQDEAFQLFDSQNARGRELEPYDLLKAFHLREMEFDTENEKSKCVERWEKSVDEKTLKPILGNHLFKIRKWSKNERNYNFTKNDIDEFKGISLHSKQKHPFESTLRMLDGFVGNAQKDKFLQNAHIAQDYPFTITMPIINGKRFFEYVDFYILQRVKLFDLDKEDTIKAEKPDFVEFYQKYCRYSYSGRSGDEKVRNLYDNILFTFIDKFGFVDDFENYYKAFYKTVYKIRCNNKSIRLETILNSNEKKIIREINDSINLDKLKNYQFNQYHITENDLANGVAFIKKAINNNFIENGSEAI